MHDLVRDLALQVYRNICNNTQEVWRHLFHIVSPQTMPYIAQTQYMYDFLQTLFHTSILGGEGTVMKIDTKCNRCGLFQTMSELACCHTD